MLDQARVLWSQATLQMVVSLARIAEKLLKSIHSDRAGRHRRSALLRDHYPGLGRRFRLLLSSQAQHAHERRVRRRQSLWCACRLLRRAHLQAIPPARRLGEGHSYDCHTVPGTLVCGEFATAFFKLHDEFRQRTNKRGPM